MSVGVHSEICSVCTTILKRMAGLCFYPKSSILYINGFVSTSSTNKWKAFFKFQISSRIIGRKPNNTYSNEYLMRRENRSMYNVLYINGFVLTSSTILWKTFFKFGIRFRIIGQKPKNSETIRNV